MAEIMVPTPFPLPDGSSLHEFVGRISTGHSNVSIAHHQAESYWSEAGQAPAFDEFIYVIDGSMSIVHAEGSLLVQAGQVAMSRSGQWLQCSAGKGGAEYLTICVPAFDLEGAHRDS